MAEGILMVGIFVKIIIYMVDSYFHLGIFDKLSKKF